MTKGFAAIGPISHAVMFGGMMADEAVHPEEESDGFAWAHKVSGEEIENFILGKVLDRITERPAVDPTTGERTDEILKKEDIPARVEDLLADYGKAAVKLNAQSKEGGDDDPISPEHGTGAGGIKRRKMPLLAHHHTARTMPLVA